MARGDPPDDDGVWLSDCDFNMKPYVDVAFDTTDVVIVPTSLHGLEHDVLLMPGEIADQLERITGSPAPEATRLRRDDGRIMHVLKAPNPDQLGALRRVLKRRTLTITVDTAE